MLCYAQQARHGATVQLVRGSMHITAQTRVPNVQQVEQVKHDVMPHVTDMGADAW